MSERRLVVRLAEPPAGVRVRHGAGALAAVLDEHVADARAEGLALGRAEAGAQVEAILARVAEAERETSELLASTAISLARHIAERILLQELEEGRYDLEGIVRETLQASGVGRGEVTVHLHPADAASLADVSFRAGTVVEGDVEVPRGHVHVVTPLGVLVRNADEMVEAIVQRLRDESGA